MVDKYPIYPSASSLIDTRSSSVDLFGNDNETINLEEIKKLPFELRYIVRNLYLAFREVDI